LSLLGNWHGQKRTSTGIISLMLLTVVISGTLSGCYFFPKEEEVLAPPIKEPDKIAYETIEVKKGNIENTITCTGTFTSVSQKDLFYKTRGGRLQEIYVSHGDDVKKGELLAQLETDTILNDIKLQEIELKRAQIAYDSEKMRLDIEGGSKTALELNELNLQSSQIRLEDLKAQLEQTRLVSPIDGEVVYVTTVRLGEFINAHQTVVRVADPTKLQLKYSQNKVDIFNLGMKAIIDITNKKYTGKVIMTPGNVPPDADEEARKSVMLSVENLPASTEVGDAATISVTLEKRDNVIVLPKQVVNNFVGRKFVNVLKNGIREERDIELGIENSTEVEVVKGLEVGEVIIVR
jgi:macrolide-specific efflux system membrane fusion protein